MKSTSIRVRLAAWYLSVLVAALILLGAGVWIALRHELYRSLNNSLSASAAGLSHFLESESHGSDLAAILEEAREYTSGLPHGNRVRLFDANGSLLLTFPQAEPPERMFQRTERIAVRGHEFTVELTAPVDQIDETLSALRNVLLAFIPIVFLTAALGGWWLSRTALQPVDRMTAAAESIGLTDLSERLPVPNTGDELERFGEAWNRMLDRLANSVERMKRFTADAAHELRTPTAIIRSTAELALRRERDAAQYRAALNTIADEALFLSELVADLMWLARNDAGDVKYTFEDIQIAGVVKTVCRSAERLANARGVILRTEIATDTSQTIRADRRALRRVLLILADNAVKFTRSGGTVVIRVAIQNDSCLLEVQDSGTGIDSKDLPFIFDRFYTGNHDVSGFGLGLSIAKTVIEAHGGSIDVQSFPGAGSSFQILLPLNRFRAYGSPSQLIVENRRHK